MARWLPFILVAVVACGNDSAKSVPAIPDCRTASCPAGALCTAVEPETWVCVEQEGSGEGEGEGEGEGVGASREIVIGEYDHDADREDAFVTYYPEVTTPLPLPADLSVEDLSAFRLTSADEGVGVAIAVLDDRNCYFRYDRGAGMTLIDVPHEVGSPWINQLQNIALAEVDGEEVWVFAAGSPGSGRDIVMRVGDTWSRIDIHSVDWPEDRRMQLMGVDDSGNLVFGETSRLTGTSDLKPFVLNPSTRQVVQREWINGPTSGDKYVVTWLSDFNGGAGRGYALYGDRDACSDTLAQRRRRRTAWLCRTDLRCHELALPESGLFPLGRHLDNANDPRLVAVPLADPPPTDPDCDDEIERRYPHSAGFFNFQRGTTAIHDLPTSNEVEMCTAYPDFDDETLVRLLFYDREADELVEFVYDLTDDSLTLASDVRIRTLAAANRFGMPREVCEGVWYTHWDVIWRDPLSH